MNDMISTRRILPIACLLLVALPAAWSGAATRSAPTPRPTSGVARPPARPAEARPAATPPVELAPGERILNYLSQVTISQDGWLTVVETITVKAEGDQIQHGIYRDFPVRYAGGWFTTTTVPFEVVKVACDGKPERFRVTEASDELLRQGDKRVYIGNPDATIAPGVHAYVLTYRTRRQVGFFSDHDELYWNVTGNFWKFPIDQVTATVALPAGVGADQLRLEAYTGPKGDKGKDYLATAAAAPGAQAEFKTTRPLGAGEGLTIVVSFPKGIVREPSPQEKLWALAQDNTVALTGLGGLAALALYYLVAWALVGRDPPKGVIIPLFDPPAKLCPASVRYIARMGFDNTCLVAALVSLAVKRYLTIKEDAGDYQLIRAAQDDRAGLSHAECKVADWLFDGRTTLMLGYANAPVFRSALAGLKKVLASELREKNFRPNTGWFVVGMVLTVLSFLGMGLSAGITGAGAPVIFLLVWLSGWTFGCAMMLKQVVSNWKRRSAGVVGMLVGCSLFWAFEIAAFALLLLLTSVLLAPVLVGLIAMNFIFFRLLKRPTPEGRKLMDQIDGLRMYLATAEPELAPLTRLPAKTPELFERHLPFALALGVENAWADKFAAVLTAATAAPQTAGYSPVWYQYSGATALGTTALAAALGASFAGAVSASSASPGSSSGGGGGGSSGGGGGGGGGGGW